MDKVDESGRTVKARMKNGTVAKIENGKRLYRVWRGMHERCGSQNHVSYHRYGGRGIFVCAEWQSFPAFAVWANANGYADGLEFDRIDNDGPYSPQNCRLATHRENGKNRPGVGVVQIGGKSMSYTEASEHSAVSRKTIRRRLDKGHGVADAVTLPAYHETSRMVTAFGETKKLSDWCLDSRCSVPYSALLYRIDSGWAPEDAVSRPSGEILANQRNAAKVAAFGESKSIPQWSRDPRCRCGKSALRQRIVEYKWPAEMAILTPKHGREAVSA